MVSLVNDPRHPYFQKMEVKYLGNVFEGRKVVYINVPISIMKQVAVSTLEKGKPVWFGCDVGKFHDSKNGLLDLNSITYHSAFNVDVLQSMSKADRLRYRESQMTHA
jgi:bleomycin hydrolase